MTSAAHAVDRFYEESSANLKERLAAAHKVDGLDEEIALIRGELNRHFHEHPGDIATVLKCVGLLVRTIAQRHRMQPRETKKLEDWTIESLKEVAAQFRPPEEDEV